MSEVLQEGNYDILELFPPAQGMNRNIAPDILTPDFATALENILPMPLGTATVRYGTRLLPGINLNAENVIMESFPFNKVDGSPQTLLYVQKYVQDYSTSNIQILSANSFRFRTNTPNLYITDTAIKIMYSLNGQVTVFNYINNCVVVGNIVTVTIQDNSFVFPAGQMVINSIWYSQASIYVYNFNSSTLSAELITGLSSGCVPRAVNFLNKLIICNGVDPIMSWDGTNLIKVVDFIKENTATNFVRVNNTTFEFTISEPLRFIFDISRYENGNTIRLKNNGVIFTTIVTNIIRNNNTVVIKTADILPNFTPQMTLFFQAAPPAFNFMFVAYNRLWGLGTGAVSLAYRIPDQALRVYFSYQSNTLTGWFNENTRTVPSIDLSATHNVPDNIEAMAFINNNIAFIGRERTQIWTGSEPLGAAVDPNRPMFQFAGLLPVGAVHGNLIIDMPNDSYFVSQNGILSFSTLNVAKQFSATASTAVDPLVRQYVASITNSNVAYRACRAFKYKSGSFCGFKIGLNKILISLYSTNLYSWTLFSGDFSAAQTFLSDVDECLYLAIRNNIFQYADGNSGVPIYGDNDGKNLINFLWTMPVIHMKGKRYANKRYEIRCDYSSGTVLNKANAMSIIIDGDLSKTFMLQDSYLFEYKGDALNTVPFIDPANIGADPNNPPVNALGFRLDSPYMFFKNRLKFLSSNFTVNILGSTMNGQIRIKKVRLFGIIESG